MKMIEMCLRGIYIFLIVLNVNAIKLITANPGQCKINHTDDIPSCFKYNVSVNHRVSNEGFHRKLHITVKFESAKGLTGNCSLHVKQNLTNRAYINPYEINDIIVVGDVDVEKSSQDSDPTIVYISEHNITRLRYAFEIPIHLRYQEAEMNGGYSKATIPPPTILLRCGDNSICGWKETVPMSSGSNPYFTIIETKPETGDIILMVPVGDSQLLETVTTLTVICAFGGCYYLLSTVFSMSLPYRSY